MRRSLFFIALFVFISCCAFAQKPDVIRVRKPKEARCSATLLGSPGGPISRILLPGASRIQVSGPCDYKVESYVFSVAVKDKLIYEIPSEQDSLSLQSKFILQTLSAGSRFFIEKIKVKSNITGQTFSLPSLKFTVTP